MIPNQPKAVGTRLTFTMEAIVLNLLRRLDRRPSHRTMHTMSASIRNNPRAKVF
jgi:hypothetical protein